MLLVGDVGNTNTRVAAWEDGELSRLSVSPTQQLENCARVGGLAARAAGGEMGGAELALCCVVAAVEAAWREWAAGEGRELLLVRGDTDTPLQNRYRDPARLGGDRLAAAVGAVRRFGAPIVVVSLGTATVVDAVSQDRQFLGGAIAAGVQTGLDALAERTGALPRVEAGGTTEPVGDNTEACLLSGAAHGTASLVEGLVERMRGEVGAEAGLVLTGGHAALISQHLRVEHQVVPALTLEGVAAVWEHNRGKSA
ncbi:MAG: type III pantothenate kinase [Armatimonadota bacterium]|nr:MAG: type III pantothenate kinase [Armatimonadota bacterium]